MHLSHVALLVEVRWLSGALAGLHLSLGVTLLRRLPLNSVRLLFLTLQKTFLSLNFVVFLFSEAGIDVLL